MFTGLIEEVGVITNLRPQKESVLLNVSCHDTLRGASLGDSMAVDGICLTVTQVEKTGFLTLASAETLRRTNLVFKQVGDSVNLERPLTLERKLGGHLVQGHVDGTARVASIKPEGDCQMWKFEMDEGLAKYFVPKGSVAVDGISLTVVETGKNWFTVAIIPRTLNATTFHFRKPGDIVNIETDIIGKYVYRYLHPESPAEVEDEPTSPSLTLDILQGPPKPN